MSSPHAHSDVHEEHDDAPEWIRDYNATLAKRSYQKPTPPGPHCCSICCSFFASIGACFLFLVSSLMRQNPPFSNLHMGSDSAELTLKANPVAYAGFLYLIVAITSVCYWVQGNALKKEWTDEHGTST